MSLHESIPKIAITPGSEDEDDQSNLNLVEALTDTEVLNEDVLKVKSKKSKLKVKVREDDFATDIEDYEASDVEEDKEIDLQENESLDYLLLEGAVVEESQNIHVDTSDGEKLRKDQNSVSHTDNRKQWEWPVKDSLKITIEAQCLTDDENFSSDNELLPYEAELSDVSLSYTMDNFDIVDKVQDCTRLIHWKDNVSKCNNLLEATQNISCLSVSPNLSDPTDVEFLNSDSDDEQNYKKCTLRRRRRRTGRKKSNSDMDDSELSKYVKNQSCQKVFNTRGVKDQSHSLVFDSDNDDVHISFPLCKNVQRKQQLLKVSDRDVDSVTDVEDIEGDVEENDTTIYKDPTAMEDIKFEEKLNDIAAYYGQVQDTFTVLDESSQKTINKRCPFTAESCDSDADIDIVTNQDQGMKFTNTDDHILLKGILNQEFESVSGNRDDIINQDLNENLCSLELYLTEDDDDINNFNKRYSIPEVELPPANPSLILLKENESHSTIQILPLQNKLIGTFEYVFERSDTDEEYISNDLIDSLDSLPKVKEFTFPPEGYGNIDITKEFTQNANHLSKAEDINEPLTDTEDLFIETKRKYRRAPKFKHIFGNKKNLKPKNDVMLLTDTEDIYFSDNNAGNIASNALLPPPNTDDVITDTENLELSEDENDQCKLRSISCTPIHMKEIGSDVTVSKEGSGPFSMKDRMQLHIPMTMVTNATSTPTYTDTEEVDASADEDAIHCSRAETATPSYIHNELDQASATNVQSEVLKKFDSDSLAGVMYLKGGGYTERTTDVEYISEEEYCANKVSNGKKSYDDLLCNSVDERRFFNGCGDHGAFNALQEWDATRKPAEPDFKALEKDATQKEEASSSAVREPSPSIRAEGEEGEKDETGSERKVADQHQLSEEMKALLKELEKESKQ